MTTMTRERLLSEAEHLMREKGYSAFSYADLSKIVGITKASIHHHFPTKDILGEQVVIQAFSDTQRVFEQIEATEKSAEKRIAAYIDIFAQSHKASLLPLCCALSAETANLPQAITVQKVMVLFMVLAYFIAIGLTEINGICVNNVLKECFNLDYVEIVRKSVR